MQRILVRLSRWAFFSATASTECREFHYCNFVREIRRKLSHRMDAHLAKKLTGTSSELHPGND